MKSRQGLLVMAWIGDNTVMIMPEIVRFNVAPLDYTHASWLAELADGDLFIKLRTELSCARADRRLSAFLLREFGLHGRYCTQFAGALERLALRDPALLQKWVVYLGVTLNANRVQQAVTRDEVLAIKQSIGEPAYQFALNRAPYLTPLPLSLLPEKAYSEDFYRHAVGCGMNALGTAFSRCEAALTERLRLKLPRSWSEAEESVWQVNADPQSESLAAAAFCERVAVELEMLDECA